MYMVSALCTQVRGLSDVCTQVHGLSDALYGLINVCTHVHRFRSVRIHVNGFSDYVHRHMAQQCMYTRVHGFSCVHACTWTERCMYTHVHGSAMYASVQRRQLSSRARCVTTFDADVNRCVGGHGVMCDRFLREKKGFLTLCLTLTVRARATVSHTNRCWKR